MWFDHSSPNPHFLGSGSITGKILSLEGGSRVTMDFGVKDGAGNTVATPVDIANLTIFFLGQGSGGKHEWHYANGCLLQGVLDLRDGLTFVFQLPADKKSEFLNLGIGDDQNAYKAWMRDVITSGQFQSIAVNAADYANAGQ
jgi:hypothetical protein